MAADQEGLRIGELDNDIVTFDSRELAMELVGILGLVEIELWCDETGMTTVLMVARAILLTLDLASVVIEIAEKAEERGEAGISVVETA